MATIRERTTKSGDKHFQALVRLKGHPPQTATFKRKTDAKKWVANTESAIREGRHFKTVEAKKHTLGELIDRYIRDVLPHKPKSRTQQGRQLKWWKEEIGAYLLSDITPALIGEKRDLLLKSRQPATTVRYLAALSHCFTVAIKEWGWVEDNPLKKVRKPKEPRGRTRFLSDDERNKLLQACKESPCFELYPIVVLALSTGMRQGEILTLTWDQINLKENYLILEETKNGEVRRVPVVGYAHQLLTELSKVRRLDSRLVFPSSRNPKVPIFIRTPWGKAVKKAEIDDFRFHDLRHSAASYLAMDGASIAEIAEILGHKTLQMVKRYSHLSEAHTSKVLSSMNEKIFNEQGQA